MLFRSVTADVIEHAKIHGDIKNPYIQNAINIQKSNSVINEMTSNTKYRKYSTQATAESVGYKNYE